MARMTEDSYTVLFEYGKRVYSGEISLSDAAQKAHESNPEVAESSAKHYIRWYPTMRRGEFLTWNSNCSLLLYYAKRILEEEGPAAGETALSSVQKYAVHAGRRDLERDLLQLAAENGIAMPADTGAAVPTPAADDPGMEESDEDEFDVKEAVLDISVYIRSRGFSYPEGLIENFYLSLKSRPFVILAGISGTGKTRLVKLFAEAIGAAFYLVPVRPDWSDGSDLFGHLDLNGNFIPGPVCAAFDAARRTPDGPVFLCLDEMNLARVEYYLSDFLSVIESRERTPSGRIVTEAIDRYPDGIPDNLYVVGTVNMDETTFPFSRKVLDRANTIEFSHIDLMPQLEPVAQMPPLQLPNTFLRADYLVLASDCTDDREQVIKICTELQRLNRILEKGNAHVGYRVRDEIVFYMLNNSNAGYLLPEAAAFDNAIMQKILPRLQGSSAVMKELLLELYQYCRGNLAGIDRDAVDCGRQMQEAADTADYPASAAKIGYMMTRFEEDGFTSFWL